MVVDLREYRFRGARAEGEGRTLEEAIDRLADFWDSRPSLVPHAWGVLKLAITIEGTEAIFEVTDPALLDELESGNTGAFVAWMAERMGVSPEDASDLLDRSSEVVAAVDRIRPPGNEAWDPDFGFDAEEVLPEATLAWVAELGREVDVQIKLEGGRARSAKTKRLLESVIQTSMERGMTDREISKTTGLPRSTVRDTRMRIERKTKVVEGFTSRRPGQRLTPEQKAIVLDTLAKNDGNAAQTGRDLGLAPRTVRGLRARVERSREAVVSSPRRTYSEVERNQVLTLVEQGYSAAEAGRQIGVSPRTAQRWVKKSRE